MRNVNRLVKSVVLAALAFLVWGCSSSNGGAPAFNAQGQHPADWVQAHPAIFLKNPAQCVECHGNTTDPGGGISRVSCASASFNGVACHPEGPGHLAGFADPDQHGARAKAKAEGINGFNYCQICHGNAFTGGTFVVGLVAPSCVDNVNCHGVGGFPHSPPPWTDINPASPAPFRSHTTTDESNALVCYQCHGSVVTTIPGCFNATMCHATMECINCHGNGAGPDVEFFSGEFWNSGNPGLIRINGEWDTTGHGRPSNTSYASGNPGAGFIFAKGCEYCHDPSIRHKQAANPFRLRNLADAVWGKNGVCMNCHASGSAGIIVAGVLKNSTIKIGAYHNGEAHTAALNGGQFCWDCHDGHGDSNIFMIHDNVAPTSDATTAAPTSQAAVVFTAFATGNDYAKVVAPFNGICNVCHTESDFPYTSTSGDATHNQGIRCTQCHTHNGDAKNTAFKPPASTGGFGSPHIFPFPGSDHSLVASSSCLICHPDGTNIGIYPVPAGTPPDCRGCHTKADPFVAGCGSCHGPSGGNGRPNGSAFPDIAARHNDPNAHAQVCSTCHGANGSGQATHGPSNRTAHGDANVVIQFTGSLSNGANPFSFTRTGNGHGQCAGTCHVSPPEIHGNRTW